MNELQKVPETPERKPTAPPQEEHAEYEAVLTSRVLSRSSNLKSILTVICTRYFDGEEHTSEYLIALEALHRSSDFNPGEDATVRVQMHSLRKKIKQFYETEGAARPMRMSIPVGRYAPQFTVLPGRLDELESHAEAVAPTSSPLLAKLAHVLQTARWTIPAAVLALLLLTALVGWYRHLHPRGRFLPAEEPVAAESDIPQEKILRIAAGSNSAYPDSVGNFWTADQWRTGGKHFSRRSHVIGRTYEQHLFQDGQEGDFTYDIPLPPGSYELHLYFADTLPHQESEGQFALSLNGGPQQPLDVVADAGGAYTATGKVFLDIHPASDGKLHLAFLSRFGPAFLNGIEILPSPTGKMQTIRQTTLTTSIFDEAEHQWMPDQWFQGGRQASRSTFIRNAEGAAFYGSERFGRFNYSIPVAGHHTYTVTLYFSEAWHLKMPSPRPGLRVFDVTCNGQTLLSHLDLLKETESKNFPVVRTFRHIPPNPEDKIFLSFDPSVDYALINAIAIRDEGPRR